MTVVKLLNNINQNKENLMHLWDCSTAVSHNVGEVASIFQCWVAVGRPTLGDVSET